MTQPSTGRSRVSKKKRALSTRSAQGSKDHNYSTESSPVLRYPVKERVDGEMKVVYKETLMFPYSSQVFEQWAVGSRKRDTTNPFMVFSPSNKDFRPFIWRKPKAYVRSQWFTLGNPPKVITSKVDSFEPKDFVVRGAYVPFYGTIQCRKTPTFSQRQLHILKFNEKLAGQKVDVLTTLAEGAATVSMLADAARDLFSFYRAVKKADVKSIRRLFKAKGIKRTIKNKWRNKTAESRWLELQYGWSPMFGDLKTIMEEIASPDQIMAPIIKVSHSSVLDPSDHYNPDRYRDANFFGILKTSCYYTVTSEGLRQSAQWNLGNNPLLTAWELTPYSFIIDWFIPIGDFLAQASASQGLQFISGCSVSHVRASGTVVHPQYIYLKGNMLEFEHTALQHGFHTERTVHYASPIGLPVFSGGVNSIKRALNALALISSRR